MIGKLVNTIAGVAALMMFMSISTTEAAAGTPWSCVCNGKPKRFIASTRICEHQLAAANGKKVRACTTEQFKAWNRKACKQEGCSPPSWAAKFTPL
jgi:hypothetical protein